MTHDAIRTGKVVGRWGAYLGIALGVLYSFGGLVADYLTTGLNLGTALAFLALVGMPVIFWGLGFALGAVVGFVTGGPRSLADR